jgi:protein OPY2
MQSLFRRCVECPPETPSCPKCPSDETCLLQTKSCDACPNAKCVPVGSLPGQVETKKASSTPVIAGGVVGGVVFIIAVTFLIWWFCIRKRRQEWDQQVWTDTDQSFAGVEKRDQSGLNRDARDSTRSMGSIATAHTRASNVIPIAYIPGITNRSPTESPGLLIPPVPPIPFGTTNTSSATSPNFEQDRHFFMPNDLRDSTYSDLSGRQSLSPSLARASMSPTIYRNNAEVSPAVQALRAKAAVVTVNKSGNNSPADLSSPEDGSPSTPQAPKGLVNSSIVARNVTARPIQVKKSNSGKKSQVPTLANLKAASANKRVSLRPQQRIEEGSEDETDASTQLISTTRAHRQSTSGTVIDDTPAIKQSQFTNTSSSASSISEAYASPTAPRGSPQRSTRSGIGGGGSSSSPGSGQLHKKNGSLNSLIEEAMTRAARDPVHGGLGSISENHNYSNTHNNNHPVSHWSESQTQGWSSSDSGTASVSPSVAGPFSDANEVRESASRSTLS